MGSSKSYMHSETNVDLSLVSVRQQAMSMNDAKQIAWAVQDP